MIGHRRRRSGDEVIILLTLRLALRVALLPNFNVMLMAVSTSRWWIDDHGLPERDMLPPDAASGPRCEGALSWRYSPRYTVTLQIWGAMLLVGLGLLLGLLVQAAARNALEQVVQSRLRQAEECKRLNETWSTAQPLRQQRSRCPYCYRSPSPEWRSFFAPRVVEEQQDDD